MRSKLTAAVAAFAAEVQRSRRVHGSLQRRRQHDAGDGQTNLAAATSAWISGPLAKQVWYVQVGARNASGTTWSAVSTVPSARKAGGGSPP